MTRTIYTANIGGLLYGELTVPRLEVYAEGVGAELVVLRETERRNPQHALLDAITRTASMGEDDWSLWVDLDIVVRDGARDVFEAYAHTGSVWSCLPTGPRWRRRFGPFARRRGVHDLVPYFTTGLVLWNGGHARKLVDAGMDRTDWPPVGDQEVFNYLLRRANVLCRYLPLEVHGIISRQKKGLSSDFVHFGSGRKLGRIRNYINRLES